MDNKIALNRHGAYMKDLWWSSELGQTFYSRKMIFYALNVYFEGMLFSNYTKMYSSNQDVHVYATYDVGADFVRIKTSLYTNVYLCSKITDIFNIQPHFKIGFYLYVHFICMCPIALQVVLKKVILFPTVNIILIVSLLWQFLKKYRAKYFSGLA